jgi:CheY-like chemotaxis protein/tetratricopeptide (TPR) repeat protein
MTLANRTLGQIDYLSLNQNERALRCCQLAKAFEERGNYEGALNAMGELWQRIGERPIVENLEQATAAEVLMRVGVLTGWIGSAHQIEGSQAAAKDLIWESLRSFEALQDHAKAAEARIGLALCYWREGGFNESRIMLSEALSQLADTNNELKAIALIRSAIVEKTAGQHGEALRIYTEIKPLLEESSNDALKGKYHNGFANLLENLGRAKHREDYIDGALIEYAAASVHFEQAGHVRYHACVENNLGFLFYTLDKFSKAHEHLDHAQALFTSLKDTAHLAGVDETRTRVLLAEGRVSEAEKLVRQAVKTLEKGGEQSLLAEALTTHGTALARLGRYQQAEVAIQQAIEVAQQAGDLEGAGQAALAMIEELGGQINSDELWATYERAVELLGNSEHAEIVARLNKCTRKVLHLMVGCPALINWDKFSLKDEVLRYERRFIERALGESKGSVTRAARLLGLKHQTLIALLNSRHQELLSIRKKVTRRRRSIIRRVAQVHGSDLEKTSTGIFILHVEDNKLVSDAVRDTLRREGWEVEVCADGDEALKRLEGEARYDLLLFDNDLPGMSGLELVRRARRLNHRRGTPIIMLSAINCAREALRAGANVFLRKPDDVLKLAATISRLLANKLRRP